MLFNIVISMCVFLILIFLSIWDIKYRVVPPAGCIAIALAGLILLIKDGDLVFHFKGASMIFAMSFLIAFITKGLGGGDIKLFTALGFAFGIGMAVEIMIFSFLLSGIFIVSTWILIKLGRIIPIFSRITTFSELPLVPFIAISYILIFTENLLY